MYYKSRISQAFFFLVYIKSLFLYATVEQCQDASYTSRYSIIKIISFDSNPLVISNLGDYNIFMGAVKDSFRGIIERDAPWVNDPDSLIDMSIPLVTSQQDSIDRWIGQASENILEQLNIMFAEQRDYGTNVSSFNIPDPIYFVNAGRIISGHCIAMQNCADVEQFGFRRYLRNPTTRNSTTRNTVSDNFRPSEFNYGRTFVYPTVSDLQDIGLVQLGDASNLHLKITEELTEYTRSNHGDKKNALFVKICVKAGTTVLYNITCGTFLSGSDKSEVVSKKHSELLEVRNYKVSQLKELTDKYRREALAEDWEIVKMYTAFHRIPSAGIPDPIGIYNKRTFGMPLSTELLLGDKRFPIYDGKSSELSIQVKKELKLSSSIITRSQIGFEIKKQDAFLAQIEALYGESALLDRFDVYGEKILQGMFSEGFEGCFHQSEQYLIQFLDKPNFDSLKDYYHIELPVTSVVTQQADKITVYCYDCKDTCRYCRAMFSHMIGTGRFKSKITNFVQKVIGEGLFAENVGIEIYAFAKETTEL